VLGGADFGAGFWQLVAGRGERGREIRDHAHHAMGPVWEANHVWLVFVLTVMWTAYPAAFASIASTLSVPLFVAGLGIVLRGGAYALRSGTVSPREQRLVDTVFAVSSVLTPFALGTAVGGIASGRVHLGNPGGSLLTSWLNPTSITTGLLATAFAAYTAAVFLSGDAQRHGNDELAERFRRRALGAGVAAGAAAFAGLGVLHADDHHLFARLATGSGLAAVILSVAAGVVTLALIYGSRYEPARYTSAIAVAAIIAGWAVAQNPVLIRGLTIRDAAAGRDTLVALVVAVVAGGALVFPSLTLLFRLTLGGRLRGGAVTTEAGIRPHRPRTRRSTLPGVALLVAGVGFLTVADASWAHAVGVIALLLFVAVTFPSVALDDEPSEFRDPA
jgi:cytochrome d ubiquinol oxidase subunit II